MWWLNHPPNLAYALTPDGMMSSSREGKSQKLKMKKGQENWSDGGFHSVENHDNSVAVSLDIELKKQKASAASTYM
jgi:hypothetical protein